MDIFELVEKQLRDPRYLYLGLLISIALAQLVYLPQAQHPTQMTIDYYNIIVNAPKGAVLMSEPGLAANWGGGAEMTRTVTWKYWLERGNTLVWVVTAGGMSYEIDLYKKTLGLTSADDISKHPLYGTQFVILPSSYPGNFYTFAANFRAGGAYDVFGTSFDKLPCIKNLKTGKDIYAYIGNPLGGDFTVALTAYGVNCIAGSDGGGLSVASTYYGIGLMKGILLGNKGANEFLVLINADTSTYPNSLAVQTRTSMALSSVFIFVVCLLLNVVNIISLQVRKKHLSGRLL